MTAPLPPPSLQSPSLTSSSLLPPSLEDQPAWLDGRFLRLGDAKVSVLDRGFIFGDGIYEVVPVYGRRPFRLAQHLARLARSLARVRIAPPHDEAGWHRIIGGLVERLPADDQFVYLQVTRGVAKRDFAFPPGLTPTVFAMTSPFTRPSAAVRAAGVSAALVPDERWLNCDIKSTSLLGAVLARQAAVDRAADEAIQVRDDLLTEGSASNAWLVSGGRVVGVPRDRRILEGIRYGLVAELCAAAGVPFEERPVPRAELLDADEILLTAATREIVAVTTLDGRPVGGRTHAAGTPGPVFQRLRAGYDAQIDALRSAPAFVATVP